MRQAAITSNQWAKSSCSSPRHHSQPQPECVRKDCGWNASANESLYSCHSQEAFLKLWTQVEEVALGSRKAKLEQFRLEEKDLCRWDEAYNRARRRQISGPTSTWNCSWGSLLWYGGMEVILGGKLSIRSTGFLLLLFSFTLIVNRESGFFF